MLITFEGIDGCGKSTHCSLLREHLEKKGEKVLLTHEPGDGGEASGNIRQTILLQEMKKTDPLAELFLFCADRVCHVEKVVKPALADGEIVICDRFFDSTIAYQGYGRGIDIDFASSAARRSALGIVPEITFFLDVPPDVCRKRLQNREKRGEFVNRLDKEKQSFYNRLREGFLSEAEKQPQRIKVVDARGEIAETQEKIVSITEERLSAK